MNSKFLTIVTLLFIAFAQVTTNVLNNIVPPSYILMESFPKVKWWHATILVGLLSIAVNPWRLVTAESADGLNLFVRIYSAFLGPVFAVMATDYLILRKEKIDVNLYYDKEGPFKGVNWAAIVATLVGALISAFVLDISWYVSLIPTALVYFLLMKYLPSSKRFCIGTILEDKETADVAEAAE
jgi:NCS1 family nucleobase:cation symporter-1